MDKLLKELFSEILAEFKAELLEDIKGVFMSKMKDLELNSRNEIQKLSYTQISEEYHVSTNTLKKWKKVGLLIPVCKGGRTLLFDRADVEECMRNRPRIKPKFLDSA